MKTAPKPLEFFLNKGAADVSDGCLRCSVDKFFYLRNEKMTSKSKNYCDFEERCEIADYFEIALSVRWKKFYVVLLRNGFFDQKSYFIKLNQNFM